MQKELAKKLEEEANKLAERFSNPTRAGNVNEETFTVVGIIPKSDHIATVTYQKNTGKLAMAVAIWIKGFDNWTLFFPTDSHLLGLRDLQSAKMKVENHNYEKNFN